MMLNNVVDTITKSQASDIMKKLSKAMAATAENL
jgi:hypothetical protein